MSLNIKKAAISGIRFQIEGNPDYIFKIVGPYSEETYYLNVNNEHLGAVQFSYKNMIITTGAAGLLFKKEVRLKDINFIEN